MSVITRQELGRFLAEFEHTAYRLELLSAYADSGESAAIKAFLAGQQPDIYPGKQGWMRKVAVATAEGRLMQRVHVVTEPLSPYLQYEIGWSYGLNESAGEDIRILPADRAPAIVLQAGDYWLFDSRTLIRMEYDSNGELASLSRISDTDAITTANDARDAALHHAVPRKQYTETQPELLHVP